MKKHGEQTLSPRDSGAKLVSALPMLVRCGTCGTVVGLTPRQCADCGAYLLATPEDGCFRCGAAAERLARVDAAAFESWHVGHAVEGRVEAHGDRLGAGV